MDEEVLNSRVLLLIENSSKSEMSLFEAIASVCKENNLDIGDMPTDFYCPKTNTFKWGVLSKLDDVPHSEIKYVDLSENRVKLEEEESKIYFSGRPSKIFRPLDKSKKFTVDFDKLSVNNKLSNAFSSRAIYTTSILDGSTLWKGVTPPQSSPMKLLASRGGILASIPGGRKKIIFRVHSQTGLTHVPPHGAH